MAKKKNARKSTTLTDSSNVSAFGTTRQLQKIPMSKRTDDWYMKNIDYYVNTSDYHYERRDHFLSLYKIAQGRMEESWYHYVANPYNSTKENETKFPAKIRNYDIISPILNLLRGEKGLRPFPYQVFVHNDDVETKQQVAEKEAINEMLIQQYMFDLQQQGFDVQGGEEPPPPPEQVIKNLRKTWADARAEMGQKGLRLIMDDQDVVKKWRDGFYDFMVTDYVFTYKDVIRNNVEYDLINPYDLSYVASPDTEYIENGEAAIRTQWMTVAEVIDRFFDTLTPKEIEELEQSQRNDSPIRSDYNQEVYNDVPRHYLANMVEVKHVVFKSMRKIGKVTTMDVFGQPIEFEVDEDFKPREGETVKWMWVNQVLEGYRIDDKLYKELGPIPFQRGTFDNPSKCKLPYNGKCYSTRHTRSMSLTEKMIPYQVLYNIIKYRLELTIAKNKDKLTMFPYGMIPKEKGWDMFTSMYYAESTGYFFFDETNKNALQAMQYIKVLDASLDQYIQYVQNYLKEIKQELEEFVGITRQRKGQTSASEGKFVTEQSIFQSSVTTEDLFMSYEDFQKKELQGLIDLSKFAWVEGKRSQYVGDDMKIHFLNIEPGDYQEAEFGIFVKTSKKENEKLEQLRNMSQAFAQNQMRPSMVADILNSENFTELRNKLEEMEELELKLQQDQSAAEAQAGQAAAEADGIDKQKDRDHESIENEKDRNLEREKMLHETQTELFNQDINDNAIPDALEIQKLTQEGLKITEDTKLKTRELDIKEKDVEVKAEGVRSKERTEKLKAKTALQNPVSGENPKKKAK